MIPQSGSKPFSQVSLSAANNKPKANTSMDPSRTVMVVDSRSMFLRMSAHYSKFGTLMLTRASYNE